MKIARTNQVSDRERNGGGLIYVKEIHLKTNLM